MKFKVLACDFDGTLASEDRIGATARRALGRAREEGLRLVLVTGRTFFELARVCDCLDLFDGVVAENGAVIYFPQDAMIRDQGPPPPKRLLAELDRRGVSYQAGRVIVGTARAAAASVREALAVTGVRRVLVSNRAALMLLPEGISKGNGVERMLRALGLSFHDALALGDAENDLPLFEACGWAACPTNGVPELRERADWVFPGEDGEGVAAAITGPVLEGRLSGRHSPRHRIRVGWVVETCEPVTVPARDVNVLIHGDPLSGKSWLAGALVERLSALRYSVLVVDPEGDYRVLGDLPGVAWVEMTSGTVDLAFAHLARHPAACVVADLSALNHGRKLTAIQSVLEQVRESRRRTGLPHWVFLDEAHYSLHRQGVRETTVIEERGFCLSTYRPSWLRDSVVRTLDVLLLARTTAEEELGFLRSRLAAFSGASRVLGALPSLPGGEFVLVEPEGEPGALTFMAAPRDTAHVRHLRKYLEARVSPGEHFVFRDASGRVAGEAQSLHEFRRVLASVDARVVAHHAGRGDFSRWVLDVFSDTELARQLRKTEARFKRRELSDLRGPVDRLIVLRYGAMDEPPAPPEAGPPRE